MVGVLCSFHEQLELPVRTCVTAEDSAFCDNPLSASSGGNTETTPNINFVQV